MEETVRRTPGVSLKEIFLRAVAGLAEKDGRGEVVAEALGYLRQGFDSRYAAAPFAADDILVGGNAYPWVVETTAHLDEPRFVAVASCMIRDGAGRIAEGGEVTLELWTPHLTGLLDTVSGGGQEKSEARIQEAAKGARARDG